MNPSHAFTTLGVPFTASPTEVKAAWRQLAKQHHPDRGGDPTEFQRYQEAYEVALKAAEHRPCPDCRGSGRIVSQRGFVCIPLPCPTCSKSK